MRSLSLIHRQERFFLSLSVKKMGGNVVPSLPTLEQSLCALKDAYSPNKGSYRIICPYLKPGQKRRIEACLGDVAIPILSSYWLYSCIDRCRALEVGSADDYDRLLFAPAVRFS